MFTLELSLAMAFPVRKKHPKTIRMEMRCNTSKVDNENVREWQQ